MLRAWSHRSLRLTTVVVALAAVFGAGYAAGRWQHGPADRHDDVLSEAANTIAKDAAHPVSRSELERAAVEGMLHALDDRWSAYYTPADFDRFQDVLDGRYAGVGLWVRRDSTGRLVVFSVQPGSPAAAAGLQVGDDLVSVSGQSVSGRSVADVVSALRGDAGTNVTVTWRREGTRVSRTLRRATLASDDVSADQLAAGVLRLRITAFTRGVGRWVRDQVGAADGQVHGIVLDLRGNPGGLLDEAVETASAFLDGGRVVTFVRRDQPPQPLDALANGDTSTPLVVLVDGGTASAAEVVAAALQDRGRAVIVGSRTFGKGSVQEPATLSDGSALELTVGSYLTPSGRSLDGVGVEPDVAVRPGSSSSVAEQRAVEVLSGMLADAGSAGRG